MAILRQPDVYLVSPPIWDNIILKRAYRTNIMMSISGDEQRSALSTKVRRELSYTIQCQSAAQTNYVKRRIMKYQHLIWGIPIWPYEMLVVSGGSAGSSDLVVNDASSRELVADTLLGEIIITTGYNTFEAKDMDSISSNTITLASALSLSWVADNKVYPVLRAELSNTQNYTLKTPEHNFITFNFVESFRNVD